MSSKSLTESEAAAPQGSRPGLHCRAKGNFADWLSRSGGSLAISTYNSGKLVLVSIRDDKLCYRTLKFPRPMGLARRGNHVAVALRGCVQLYKGAKKAVSGRVIKSTRYRLQKQYDTGKIDCHDVAFGERGLYFVNTRFSCIARATSRCQFLRYWQPPFVSQMVPEDRCHLNGLGMLDGKPAMATAFAETDTKKGWRTVDRFESGVLIDVHSSEVVVRGLCMPHSPRYHDGRWWLCNSGLGSLSVYDCENQRVEEVCALPGFTRGLCFKDDHVLVGLSRIREKHVLDTPLLRDRGIRPQAGVALVDLTTGKQSGLLEFVRGGSEVYEVLFLPGVRRPEIECT